MLGINVFDLVCSNGFSALGIYITVLGCIITGIVVIVIKNPIVSILFLIGLFLNISANFMFLGLNFIGLSYLIVYVGAVSILFLFILMLINIRISEIISSTSNSIPLAISLCLLFFSTVYYCLPFSKKNLFMSWGGGQFHLLQRQSNIYQFNNQSSEQKLTSLKHSLNFYDTESIKVGNLECYNVYSNFWDSNISPNSHISCLGNILYTNYPILIILTSLVLLLSMVGSIIITIKT